MTDMSSLENELKEELDMFSIAIARSDVMDKRMIFPNSPVSVVSTEACSVVKLLISGLQAHRSVESAWQAACRLLASNSKYVGEVLNCACRQNMVGVALFVFVKTCNYAILLSIIGSS